jgi:aspartate racemase
MEADMRTIGLLGGMSWQSTMIYYRHINELVAERLGGLHSAPLVIASVDFHDIVHLQRSGRWSEAGNRLVEAARHLERAGASAIVICTNTMHLVAPQIQAAVGIPLIHIADTTAHEVRRAGVNVVGLLGTTFTMSQEFYKGRLARTHGLEVMVPEPDDATEINRIIFEELCRGLILERSRRTFREIIQRLSDNGAEGVILGCTEIPMIVRDEDSPVPVFDTTLIHSQSAVDFILSSQDTSSLLLST